MYCFLSEDFSSDKKKSSRNIIATISSNISIILELKELTTIKCSYNIDAMLSMASIDSTNSL